MSTGVIDQPTIGVKTADAPATFPISVTEKAANEVKRIIADQQAAGAAEKLYLRISVRGGGCSGFQNKLDLDTTFNEKTDMLSEQHGVSLIADKKSLLYLQGAQIDFHEDLNARGFRITNPSAKGTCGCGSSYSM
ncbi:MAG TPA: iron-sulfur cluster assembly accessory protein [Gemmataceae bacterium]|nr:iron-sulfur cluster assembly accessory protein [Gemmataceae bacterium]